MVLVQEFFKGVDNKVKDVIYLFFVREFGLFFKQLLLKFVWLFFFERLKRFGKNKVVFQFRVEEKFSVKISIVLELVGFRGEFLVFIVELFEVEVSSVELFVDLLRFSFVLVVVQDYYFSIFVGFFEW